MAPTTYVPVPNSSDSGTFQHGQNVSSIVPTEVDEYDSKGALMYVVAVVLVYGLSIAFMIALFVRRKSQPFEESHESTNYFKEMSRIRKRARHEEHHVEIDKTRQNILKALPQLMVSSAITPEQVEMLLTAKQRALERQAAEKQRKTSSHSRISFTNSLTRDSSSQAGFTDSMPPESPHPSVHLPLIPSMDEHSTPPDSPKDFISFVADSDDLEDSSCGIKRFVFPNKQRSIKQRPGAEEAGEVERAPIDILELDAPMRKFSRSRKSHDFESLTNGAGLYADELDAVPRRTSDQPGVHGSSDGTSAHPTHQHRRERLPHARKVLVTDIDDMSSDVFESSSTTGNDDHPSEERFLQFGNDEDGTFSQQGDYIDDDPWTRQQDFQETDFMLDNEGYEGTSQNSDLIVTHMGFDECQYEDGDEQGDFHDYNWDYNANSYHDGGLTRDTGLEQPSASLPLERYLNTYDANNFDPNPQVDNIPDKRRPYRQDAFDATGHRLVEGEGRSNDAIGFTGEVAVQDTGEKDQSASPCSTRSSSGFYEVLV